MSSELKFVPLELLALRECNKPDLPRIENLIQQFSLAENRWPLVLVSSMGSRRRYRVRSDISVIYAAKALDVLGLWCLIVPLGPIPFRFGDAEEQIDVEKSSDRNRPQFKTLQQGLAFRRAHESGLSQHQIAKQFGVTRSYVNNAIQLTKLGLEVKSAFLKGHLTASQARILSYEKDIGRQEELIKWIQDDTVSVRELERAVYRKNDVRLEKLLTKAISNRLAERWGCQVSVISSGQGVRVTARPHTDFISNILNDLHHASELSDLKWSSNVSARSTREISCILPSEEIFSAWLMALRITDLDDLGLMVGE
jgi:biotin operon repressor